MIAILEAKRASMLSRVHWINNILAGVIASVVTLLLAMAFDIASGVKLEQGIFAAIAAGGLPRCLVASLLPVLLPTLLPLMRIACWLASSVTNKEFIYYEKSIYGE